MIDPKRALVAAEIATLRELLEVHEAAAREHSEKLEELLARYRSVIDSALDCVIVMDASGDVLEFNPAAEKTFGYNSSDAVGKSLAELIIPPPLRAAHRAGLRRFLRTGAEHILGRRVELPAMRADGSEFLCELTITVADTRRGPVFTGYLRDISENKRQQAAIEQLVYDQELLLDAAGDGIFRVDQRGRVTFLNAAATHMLGWTLHSLDERRVHDTIRPGALGEAEDGVTRCLRSEEVVRVARDRFTTSWGGELMVEYIAAPIREAGRVVGVVVTFRDITDRIHSELELERARDTFAFLARTSELLGSSLDYHTTLKTLTHEIVPALADWCAIDLVEHHVLTRVAATHADEECAGVLETMQRTYPFTPGDELGPGRVVTTSEPELYADIDAATLERYARTPQHAELLRRVGFCSAMVVPMSARGRLLGAIVFGSSTPGRYDESTLQLAREVARRAGIAVDNARLFQERSQVAQTLQQSLLPPVLPSVPRLELAARYRAGAEGLEVGGDFYDIFPTGDDEWTLVIGDVCGKGAQAAALTALTRYSIRTAAMQVKKPSRVLAWLNEALLATGDVERFCTVAYARLRLRSSGARLHVSSGGHPLPLILKAEGHVLPVGRAGTALGLVDAPRLYETPINLVRGDTLVLFTDGFTEARGPRGELGERGLADALAKLRGATPDEIALSLETLALDFQEGRPRDDMAILVVRLAD